MDDMSMEKLSDMAERVSSEVSEYLPTAEEAQEKLGLLVDALSRMIGTERESKDGDEEPLLQRVEKFVDSLGFMESLEEHTGIPKLVLFYVISAVTGLLMLVSITNMILGLLSTRVIGFVYPAYASFKAIESPEKEDDTQWVTYWVVFATFTLLEQTVLQPLAMLMPLYFAFKIGFLLWCQNRGAELVYVLLLRPAWSTVAKKVDGAIDTYAKGDKKRRSSTASRRPRDDSSYNPYESE